jgi:hypothetical protein
MPEVIKPSNLNLIWADAGDKIKPSDAKIAEGWIVEIPTRQNFNYLDWRQDAAISHINQRGVAEWDLNTDYLGGKSYTQGSDGVIYFCVQNTVGVDPTQDTAGEYWVEAFVTSSGYLGGKRFVGYETFSTNFTAVANHRYFLSAPATVTLPAALNGDAVVVAKDPAVIATVVDNLGTIYNLNSDDETVFVYTANKWVRLDDGGPTSGDVSLNGPVLVTQGSTNSYTISDYNAFSTYTTTTSVGTFTRTNNTISLVVPNPANATQITLTVTRDGNPQSFLVAVGAQSVATPTITYPSQGQTAVERAPTLTGSAFATVPTGQDTHQSSQWQIASDAGFTTIVYDSGVSTTNKTSVQVPSGVLALGTVYYARVRYTGVIIGASAWSPVRTFTTANQSVNTPTVSVTGSPTNVGETPTLTTSAFSVSSGTDTHTSTDWQIVRVTDSVVVWQSMGNTTNKTSIIVPGGILQVNTQYTARARHSGAASGSSAYGESTFTTQVQFFVFDPSSAGMAYGGGYYAGANIVVDGIEYALIVAPKAQGGESGSTMRFNYYTNSPGPTNSYNGASNTEFLQAQTSGLNTYDAANFCGNLTINGYADWYLPAKDEMEICYRYLKPSTDITAISGGAGVNNYSNPTGTAYTSANRPVQTSVALFKTGGVEAFTRAQFWTSTGFNGQDECVLDMSNGYPGSVHTTQLCRVRAVRRVPIPT